MNAGVSTACFYPQHTEKAFRFLIGHNVKLIEVFLNCASELDVAYIKELRDLADAHGTRIAAIHPYSSYMEPFLFFSGYDRRFREGMDLYRKYYEACHILGANIVVFHGNRSRFPVEEPLYFERYGKLVEDADKNGVFLCHENVSYCQGSDPEFFRRMLNNLPECKFVFDVKQALRAGKEPLDYINTMGCALHHVHISDSNGHSDCLLPGKGSFDIEKLLNIIAKNNNQTNVIVEVYSDSYGENVETINGYQHLCTILSTVQ